MKLLLTLITLFGLSVNSFAAEAPKATPVKFTHREIVEIQHDNYQDVMHFSKPVIIEVYSQQCIYCKKLDSIFSALNERLGDRILFAKLSYDKEPDLVDSLNVRSFPTLIFIRNGKEIFRHTGFANRSKLLTAIKERFNIE